ncbi:MAG: transcription termination/antitermination protein NusA [Firmicutes bacterium]|nr:transcription termination/antitermination protein NusA [Bacillota bacterium]
MNLELLGALNELEKERGISKEVLMEAIEAAIVSAYKRNYGSAQHLRIEMDEKSGRIRVFALKAVVEEIQDDSLEVSLEEAREIDPRYEAGDVMEIEVTPMDFGRIAAQTAKQVVIQRIREAERSLIYDEFSNRVGEIVNGVVQRVDRRTVYIDLGKVEAVLLPSEQMPGDPYNHGVRLKTYITEVRKTTKGPQVHVSRTHPGLLKRLFELEVPEIHEGVVEIRAVAREPGARSKVAVYSRDQNVDPVGACVGPRGMRVQTVVRELRGEKIDVIAWDPDIERFVAKALSPSRVFRVYVDETTKTAKAVVPDSQLSLAIGKEGQNARLAARLTGWKIDIKSESQWSDVEVEESLRTKAEEQARLARELFAVPPEERLVAAGGEGAASEEREALVPPVPDTGGLSPDDSRTVEQDIPESGGGPMVEEPADAGSPEAQEVLWDGLDEPVGEIPDLEGRDEDLLTAGAEELEIEEYEGAPAEADFETELADSKKAKATAGGAKARKSRAVKKVELDELAVDDEQGEPLPTLYGAEAEEAEEDIDIEQFIGRNEELSVPIFLIGSEGEAAENLKGESLKSPKKASAQDKARRDGKKGQPPAGDSQEAIPEPEPKKTKKRVVRG